MLIIWFGGNKTTTYAIRTVHPNVTFHPDELTRFRFEGIIYVGF